MMTLRTLRRCWRSASVLLLLILVGCGGGSTASVTGKVTLDGQPVASGQISFYPEDGVGPTAGTSIQNGEYRIQGLVPGKKRIQVSGIAGATPAPEPKQHGQGRSGVNEERRSHLKKNVTPGPALGKATLIGNNRQVEIETGEQTVDMSLETPK